jgi:hypothetical protein
VEHRNSIESVEYNKSMVSDIFALKLNLDPNDICFDKFVNYDQDHQLGDERFRKIRRRAKMQKRKN